MRNVEEQLAELLAGRVCLFGVGNRMKADDGAGPLLVERLAGCVAAMCVDGGIAPENHLEKIVRGGPDVVLVADAVDFGGTPGEVRIMPPGGMSGGGISTHAPSLELVCRYLGERSSARIHILAVQPASVHLGGQMSAQVDKAVDEIAAILSGLLPPAD